MGNKPTRKRQHFFIFLAGLMLLAGCTAGKLEKVHKIDKALPEANGRETLVVAQKLLSSGDYPAAILETEKALLVSDGKPPADEARFQLGLLYSHFKNPVKDHAKALDHFRKLIENHPQSPWTPRAQVLMALLHENEAAHRSLNKIREESSHSAQIIKKLKEENDQLSETLQRLKEIDIEIEDKKKKNK